MNASLCLMRRSLFLISAPFVYITFALPLRAEDLGASAFQIGMLYSIFTISVFFVRPLVGVGLDHMGRRPFFLGATIFYLVANLLYAISDTVDTLFVARLFQGIGFAVLAITTETITADLTKSDGRAAAMGANIASQTRGGMTGACIGFGLVGAMPVHAWVMSFTSFSVIALLAVIYAFYVIPETLTVEHKNSPPPKFEMPAGYRHVLIIIFCAAFAGAIIQPYYLIYLRGRFGLELYALAVAFLPMGIAYAILPPLLGKITNNLRRTRAMGLGFALAALSYGLVPLLDNFYWVIGVFVSASIGSVLLELTKSAWVADLSERGDDNRSAGRAFGYAALAVGGGAALGPLAGGYVYDQYGGDFLFYFSSIVLMVAILLTSAFKADTRLS